MSLPENMGNNIFPPWCLIKVDIKKAIDFLNWDFLKFLLPYFGFLKRFTAWVLICVTSTHFSLIINRNIEGYFTGKRGLRQGDPLSPHLFVLCMKYLSRMLRLLPKHNGFSYHPKCSKRNFTHLLFADDLLVFTR